MGGQDFDGGEQSRDRGVPQSSTRKNPVPGDHALASTKYVNIYRPIPSMFHQYLTSTRLKLPHGNNKCY